MPETPENSSAPDVPLPILGHIPSRWNPPTDGSVTTHVGTMLMPNFLYLSPPPPEIGQVFTAYTTLHTEKGADPMTGKRIGSSIGGFFLGALLGGYLLLRLHFFSFILLGICAVVGAIVGWFTSNPKHQTTYVGENGVAQFHYGGKASHVGKENRLVFSQAAQLKAKQTRHHYNGAYTHTEYIYDWQDAMGKPVFKITGQHKNKDGNPPVDDPYWFGAAAERAWTRYQFIQAQQALAQGQAVSFPVQGKGTLVLTDDTLTFNFKNKQETLTRDTIGKVGMNNGEVTIARADAKKGFLGIGKDGIFSFPYADLSNAQLFLTLLADLIGQHEDPTQEGSGVAAPTAEAEGAAAPSAQA